MEPIETHDEVVVDDVGDNNETVAETTEETTPKAEKPKRTPQEELEYFEGRAARLRKKLGQEKDSDAKPQKTQDSSKPNEIELDYGKKAYLKAFGIQGADELQLVKTEIKRSGLELDELVGNEYFMSKIQSLREARESANAIPKAKNRSGQTGVTDLDTAVARYKDTGELPSDFNTRNKVIDAITKSESSSLFSGPSIITQ